MGLFEIAQHPLAQAIDPRFSVQDGEPHPCTIPHDPYHHRRLQLWNGPSNTGIQWLWLAITAQLSLRRTGRHHCLERRSSLYPERADAIPHNVCGPLWIHTMIY